MTDEVDLISRLLVDLFAHKHDNTVGDMTVISVTLLHYTGCSRISLAVSKYTETRFPQLCTNHAFLDMKHSLVTKYM